MQLIGQLFEARRWAGGASGDHRRRDLGRHRLGRDRGVPRARRVSVFILFPHGRVSEVQRRQMTTPVEANVHALALTGDFDDCQARVKDMFNDFAFRDAVAAGRGELDQLGAGAGAGGLLLHRRRGAGRARTGRSASPCPPAISATSSRAISPGHGPADRALVMATNQNDILHRALSPAITCRWRDARRSARRWTSRSRRISSVRCSMPMAGTARGGRS
jgi:threonine synthase